MQNRGAAETERSGKPRWFLHRERGNAFALWLIRSIALYLGRRPARLLLYPITLYFLIRAHPERRASLDYLRRILGGRKSYWNVARHIHTFAATIVDRVYLLADMHHRFDLRFHDIDLVLERVDKGQGALLLGSHLGSFEVMRAMGVMRDHLPLKVLMYPDHNRVMTRMLNALNPSISDTVIDLGHPDSLIKVHQYVSQGYLVGMLADRAGESGRVTRCRFLDEEANFPAGPMLLAATLQVPVILFFALYRGGNRYDIFFELLAERVTIGRSSRDADVQRWTQKYADRLEHYARQAPFNWFNFYDFWDSAPTPP